MNRVHEKIEKLAKRGSLDKRSSSKSGLGHGGEGRKARSSGGGGEPATVKLAETVSRELFGHALSRGEKSVAGPAVHYGYGALAGGVYGALAEASPAVTGGAGLAFAGTLWLLGDEVAVPMLGLAKGPSHYPASTHASALGSHLVYGLTLELTRRMVRGAL